AWVLDHQDPRDNARGNWRRRGNDVMAWRNDSEREWHWLPYRDRNLCRHFHRGGPGADQGQKISSVPLLADDCRDDHGWHDTGRLLHEIARHRLYRRFNDLAYLCDRVACDLAVGNRKHINRNSEYPERRNFLLGDNHVFPNLGDGAWRLGG